MDQWAYASFPSRGIKEGSWACFSNDASLSFNDAFWVICYFDKAVVVIIAAGRCPSKKIL